MAAPPHSGKCGQTGSRHGPGVPQRPSAWWEKKPVSFNSCPVLLKVTLRSDLVVLEKTSSELTGPVFGKAPPAHPQEVSDLQQLQFCCLSKSVNSTRVRRRLLLEIHTIKGSVRTNYTILLASSRKSSFGFEMSVCSPKHSFVDHWKNKHRTWLWIIHRTHSSRRFLGDFDVDEALWIIQINRTLFLGRYVAVEFLKCNFSKIPAEIS